MTHDTHTARQEDEHQAPDQDTPLEAPQALQESNIGSKAPSAAQAPNSGSWFDFNDAIYEDDVFCSATNKMRIQRQSG